jgi:hypothetical protein
MGVDRMRIMPSQFCHVQAHVHAAAFCARLKISNVSGGGASDETRANASDLCHQFSDNLTGEAPVEGQDL